MCFVCGVWFFFRFLLLEICIVWLGSLCCMSFGLQSFTQWWFRLSVSQACYICLDVFLAQIREVPVTHFVITMEN